METPDPINFSALAKSSVLCTDARINNGRMEGLVVQVRMSGWEISFQELEMYVQKAACKSLI